MPWTMLDDGFPDHPKLVGLTLEQVGLWVLGINYANRYLTDGAIPTAALAALHPATPLARKRRMAEALVDAGLWDETPGGWAVHDFHEYQLTADEVRDRRAKRAEAGRKGGRRSAEIRRAKAEASASPKARSNGQTSAQANASTDVAESFEANGNPIPSLPTEELTSSTESRPSEPPHDDEDPRIEAALRLLADEDVRAAETDGIDIRHPKAFAASCLANRRESDHQRIALTALEHPNAHPRDLAHPPDPRGHFLPGTGWITT